MMGTCLAGTCWVYDVKHLLKAPAPQTNNAPRSPKAVAVQTSKAVE